MFICLSSDSEFSYVFALFGALLGIILGFLPVLQQFRRVFKETGTQGQGPAIPEPGPFKVNAQLQRDLEDIWQKCSLAQLPAANAFGVRVTACFARLEASFGFQVDSAKNQFEHFLSLWRSHVAVAAERQLQSQPKDEVEATILSQGIKELHSDLLQGFALWSTGARPGIHGRWRLERSETEDKEITELEEVVAFLLVWGEAGNLRFMPEVLYFFLANVLHAKDPGSSSTTTGRSGAFLRSIVRPIYHVIFEEHYEKVDIAGPTGPDKKVLREGFDKFLPADCCNYDDWNELFANQHILMQSMPHWYFSAKLEDRYSCLMHLDWRCLLANVKSHREVHSWLAVFGGTHRIIFLHMLLLTIPLFFNQFRAMQSGLVKVRVSVVQSMSLCIV